MTHAIKGNFVYRLPAGNGHWFNPPGLHWLVGGWSASGIVTTQSGTPFSIFSRRGTVNRTSGGRSDNNTANTTLTKKQLDQLLKFRQTSSGPFFIAASAIGADGRAVAPDGSAPFDGEVFFHPAAGTSGSLQRMWFSGPWVFDTDFALTKSTRIKERQSVDLRMDASNIFNHPTWQLADQLISSATFGRITSNFFGRRIIQLSLHYRF